MFKSVTLKGTPFAGLLSNPGEAQKPCFLHFSSRLGRLLQQSAFRSKTTIDFAKSPFIAKPLKKRRSISLKKSTARQQKFFRAPKSHDASILFGKHIANAKDFSIVFEHRDRSREASARRSISVEKSTARQQKMFGPRKPRCVDFIRQTLSKRYDFFRRFRRDRSRHREVAKWAGLGWLARHPRLIFIKDTPSPKTQVNSFA